MTIVKKKRVRIKNRDKSRDYIDGPTLQRLLEEWYASGKEEVPYKVIKACQQIVRRLATRGNFGRYSYLDEMIGEADESVTIALMFKKYDITRGNPFAYFTQIAWNAMVAVINKEHKESYVKHKSLQNHYQECMIVGEDMTEIKAVEELNSDLIEKFEAKTRKKKTKKATKEAEEPLGKFLSEE